MYGYCSRKPTLYPVGLRQTFGDQALTEAGLNSVTEEEIVHLLEIDGEEYPAIDHLRLIHLSGNGDERTFLWKRMLTWSACYRVQETAEETVFVQVER